MKKQEPEEIALNIIKILSRTGNEWRPLSWEEYKLEREKDGGYPDSEKSYFESISPYCKSADTAALFSKNWGKP